MRYWFIILIGLKVQDAMRTVKIKTCGVLKLVLLIVDLGCQVVTDVADLSNGVLHNKRNLGRQ
jgi:hypothetical protein